MGWIMNRSIPGMERRKENFRVGEKPEGKDSMEHISAAFGKGKYAVKGTAVLCGQDVNMVFTGGTLPHAGAVSMGIYEPVRGSATVSTITAFTHRDDKLSAEGAKKAAAALECTSVVTVGIHIDDADVRELNILCANFEQCCDRLIQNIKERRSDRK